MLAYVRSTREKCEPMSNMYVPFSFVLTSDATSGVEGEEAISVIVRSSVVVTGRESSKQGIGV